MNRLSNIKRAALLIGLAFSLHSVDAAEDTYSIDRLDHFYDSFGCDEKQITSEAGITRPCDITPQPPAPPPPPPPPPPDSCGALISAPTFPALAQEAPSADLVPIVLINNTGLPDSDVFFVIYGRPVSGCTGSGPVTEDFSFVNFGTAPGGPFTTTGTTGGAAGTSNAMSLPSSETYSYAFSNIPQTNGQTIVYVPYMQSAIVLYSVESKLDLTVGVDSIAIPVATDPGDANYLTVYGGMEYTFYPPNCPNSINPLNALTVDFTCVDYYGLSVYFNLYTNSQTPNNNPAGIYQSRHHTLCKLEETLNTASSAALSNWTGLIQRDGEKILRVVSPGYSMSHADAGGTFDVNYFNNAMEYGYSWANDVWTGANAYYNTHEVTVITDAASGNVSFVGKTVSGDFIFTGDSPIGTETFTIPWLDAPVMMGGFTTSTALFETQAFFPGMTYSLNGSSACTIDDMSCPANGLAQSRAEQITKQLSASIVAGLLPGKVSKLPSSSFPPSVVAEYDTPNPNLTPPGTTTGPWFDLYSKGMLGDYLTTGNAVYTYAYDDYLYKNAFNVAPGVATINSSTYIAVILGPYTDN